MRRRDVLTLGDEALWRAIRNLNVAVVILSLAVLVNAAALFVVAR